MPSIARRGGTDMFYLNNGTKDPTVISSGTEDPNGRVTGNIGDMYLCAGTPGPCFYVKESGTGTDTGWVVK